MDEKTRKTMHSSESVHWNTPPEVLDCIRRKWPEVLLDPCANAGSIVQPKLYFDGVNADGLAESWQKSGLVYVNPPYGRAIKSWTAKCAAEGVKAVDESNGTEIILLGPARTDTKWFHRDILRTANAVLLWEGRLTFLNAPAPAPFPSFVAYWGQHPYKFKVAFIDKGAFIA